MYAEVSTPQRSAGFHRLLIKNDAPAAMIHTMMQNRTHQLQAALYQVSYCFCKCTFVDLLCVYIHVCNHVMSTECIFFFNVSYLNMFLIVISFIYSFFGVLIFLILGLTLSAFTNKNKNFLWLHQHSPSDLCAE